MWKIIRKLGLRVDGKVRGIERHGACSLSRGELEVASDAFTSFFVQRYMGSGPRMLGRSLTGFSQPSPIGNSVDFPQAFDFLC